MTLITPNRDHRTPKMYPIRALIYVARSGSTRTSVTGITRARQFGEKIVPSFCDLTPIKQLLAATMAGVPLGQC